ncbi:hypothetical protein J1N35_001229 [Gossypium stocksii]|uniref:Uncharacterized protein n=1 Tax=Gossypium stocksii TaxID=47602 RepID=A0A9D3WIZ3_9ROSI|nr:hypothetical protein J1N35_001229 [Gossypium stocksii]
MYSINAQYGLPEGPDKHSQFVTTITAECLQQVLKDLCVEGTKWTVFLQDCYTIKCISLKPQCWERTCQDINIPVVHQHPLRLLVLGAFEKLQQQFCMMEKQHLRIASNLGRAREEMAKNFTKPMPTFANFPKELLLNLKDKDEVEAAEIGHTTHTTTEEQKNKETEGEEEMTESMNIESNKE